MKKLKTILLCIFLIWLIPTAITALITPGFHKKSPKPRAPRVHKDREYVKIVDENEEAMVRRLQIIESAKERIVLSTYYLADDDAGRDMMAALLAASQRGVKIQILVDGFCNFTSKISRKDSFEALVSEPNVEAKIYNPVHLLFPFNENYRMHDKYLIADKNVYILGGRNTRNKSIGSYTSKQDADRDALVYCEGPDSSVSQLLTYFDTIWNGPDSREVKEQAPDPQVKERLLLRYENLRKQKPDAFLPADFPSFMTLVNSVNLFVNPVAAENKAPQLFTDLLNLMGQGKDIEIQTPYIILSKQMHSHFSALTEGRNIKIITNAPETGANPMGCAELMNRKKHLLKTGFSLYEYAADRSAHVKTVVIDQNISLVGSFNLDMRSAYLDTETMLLIDSPEINRQLRETNAKYMLSSRISTKEVQNLKGAHFADPKMSFGQKIFYGLLKILIVPVRQLL